VLQGVGVILKGGFVAAEKKDLSTMPESDGSLQGRGQGSGGKGQVSLLQKREKRAYSGKKMSNFAMGVEKGSEGHASGSIAVEARARPTGEWGKKLVNLIRGRHGKNRPATGKGGGFREIVQSEEAGEKGKGIASGIKKPVLIGLRSDGKKKTSL